MTAPVKYDTMCRAIGAAYEVDEVKAIHDRAAMFANGFDGSGVEPWLSNTLQRILAASCLT